LTTSVSTAIETERRMVRALLPLLGPLIGTVSQVLYHQLAKKSARWALNCWPAIKWQSECAPLSLSPGVEGGQVCPGPRHHYGRVAYDHAHDENQAAVQAVVPAPVEAKVHDTRMKTMVLAYLTPRAEHGVQYNQHVPKLRTKVSMLPTLSRLCRSS
jgi:hypothetical protein